MLHSHLEYPFFYQNDTNLIKSILTACLSIFCFFSSFAQDANPDIIAKKVKSIDTYNSNEFVVNITDIALFNECIVMVDQDLGKVIVTDKNLKVWESFGFRGDGPQELKKPYMLIKDDDEGVIYVYDNEKFRLWPIDFNKKEIGKGASFDFMLFKQTVAMENSIIYFATVANPSVDVLKYSLKDKMKVGEFNLPENTAKSLLGRSILSANDRFIVITPYDGLVIDTYDKNWHRLNSNDLSKHPIIVKILNTKQSKGFSVSGRGSGNLRMTGAKLLMSGARLYENELYLLVSTRDKERRSWVNVILKYVYENNDWQPRGKILLPKDGSYQTFQLLHEMDQLVAFDKENGTIDLFDLN